VVPNCAEANRSILFVLSLLRVGQLDAHQLEFAVGQLEFVIGKPYRLDVFLGQAH
jgi:hypothetical protein